MGGYLVGFCGRITGVWTLPFTMGSGGSAFKDTTFCSLPYDYICSGVGRDVPARNGTTPRTPINNQFRSKTASWVNLAATGAQSIGD